MRVRVFVDDEPVPRAEFEPPDTFELDSLSLPDGPHVLVVQAGDPESPEGVSRIPFSVRNGPGIAVVGLADDETIFGRVPILVNAFQSRVGDEFEPVRAETPAPIPTWAWVLSLVVGVWAMYYVASEYRVYADRLSVTAPGVAAAPTIEAIPTTPETGPAIDTALGEQIYGNYCSACHQLDGSGVPGVFPPLRGDAVVNNSNAEEHIRIVLEGLSGKTIGGVEYRAAMPGFAAQLSDSEIAAVVNHERTSWGNAAPTASDSTVAALRGPPTP